MGCYHSFYMPVGKMYPDQFLFALTNRFGIQFSADLRSSGIPASRQFSYGFKSEKFGINVPLMCTINFGANNGRDVSFSTQKWISDNGLDKSIQDLFITMTKELGGYYIDDFTNHHVEDVGFLDHEDGVAYHLKNAVVNGVMKDKNDIAAVASSMFSYYLDFKDASVLENLKLLKAFMNKIQLSE